jgi:hypothetical protein
MHYFVLKQDESINNIPKVKNFTNNFLNRRELEDESNILFVEEDVVVEYSDFIEKPLLLISDKFKKTLKKYHKEFSYKTVILTEYKNKTQNVYWNVDLPDIDCFSKYSKFDHAGVINKLVIEKEATNDCSFFKITNKIKTKYVIRVDLAESILRRGLYGFELVEAEVV